MKRNVLTQCILFFLLLSVPGTARAAADKLTIGISPSLTGTLDVVAEAQGYFKQEGLEVELRVMAAGPIGVQAMLDDEIDLSESAIFALVKNSFSRKDFKILTTVSAAGNDNMVIGRKDRGIGRLQDLQGKKVSVLKGGFPSYVLDLMLAGAGLSLKDIQEVPEDPEASVAHITSGEVDAVCIYGRWTDLIKQALNNNYVVFHDERLCRVTVVLAGKSAKLDGNPERFRKLLRAYLRAEAYVKANPDKALAAVVNRLQLDFNSARKVWKPNLFDVALDQSLISDMENMARWQIDTGTQSTSVMPNFLDFIQFNLLESIDAKRVHIIH